MAFLLPIAKRRHLTSKTNAQTALPTTTAHEAENANAARSVYNVSLSLLLSITSCATLAEFVM